ncbi:conjugative transposon protein TraM [Parapedobacter soli]|uniref:conjugative transposon protein TraM n=1 Tax=Parapedobacter soli TaxID=416955 RepID=UPI0021C9FB4F|nr:conjugative transposon protein TraM [Parapedobacter soli]
MNRAKVIVVSILCVLGLALFLVVYNLFAGSKEKDSIEVTNAPTARVQDKFTYQEMMKYREDNPNDFRTGRTKIQVDEQNSIDTLMFRIAGLDEDDTTETKEVTEASVTDWEPYEPKAEENTVAASRPSETRRSASSGGGKAVYETSHIIEAQKEILGSAEEPQDNALPIQAQQRRRRDGFIDGSVGKGAGALAGISVVTMGDQFVEPGGVIKLRLTKAANVGGQNIPRNTIVYGSVSQGQNRLNVTVNSVQVGNTAVPANLSAYDAGDGMAGLKITQQEVNHQQESIANNAGDEILRSTGLYSLPVIGSISRGAKELLTRNRGNQNGILVTDNYNLVLK